MIDIASPEPMSLEDAVYNCVAKKTTPFTTDDALPDIVSRMTAPPSDSWTAVDEELMESEWLFYDEMKDIYVPRCRFFKGAQFLIAPQPEEIEANILIPGHRFMPFLQRDVFPAACQLSIDNDSPIQMRIDQKPIQDLFLYLSLYGHHGALQYLAADQDSNHDILDGDLNSNPEVALTVFDMTDVYARHSFKPSDTFLCTVKDWALGIYEMKVVPGIPDTLELRIQKWIEDMDAAIYQAWEEGDYFGDISGQLSEALFMGPKSLYKNPPLHLGGFLARSKKIAIDQTPLGILLTHTDTSPDCLIDRAAEAARTPITGRRDSLEAILNDLGLSTTHDEIEAYMRDACSRGEKTLDAAMLRVFSGRQETTFYNKAQIDSFETFINKLWDDVCANFTPKHDKEIAPLRLRILDMLNKHTIWLRDCDNRNIPVVDLPEAPTMALGSLTGILSQTLGILNRDEDSSKIEIHEINETLDLMEKHFNTVFSELEKVTSATSGPELRILPSPPPESESIYQLKVTLKGIRPPIWRRLLVSGGITLEYLHFIIQTAMGWDDCHLHDFQIDGVRYAPDGADDFFDMDEQESETGVLLCQVADEGSKILYTYDYGDGWEHTITVEKVLPKDKEPHIPQCIKGRRACPPEDCGGPWGYENLLEILSNPKDPEHNDMSEWAPTNFAPEAIDFTTINTQLKHLIPF